MLYVLFDVANITISEDKNKKKRKKSEDEIAKKCMKSEDEIIRTKKFHIYIIFCNFASVINHQTMIYPSVGQYTEAIKLAEQSPEDYFATKTTLRPVLGADGNPVMSSGNFAVVFKMQDQTDGKIYALKCFTRDQEGRNESYRLIADELQYIESEYLTKIQYLENELFVDTGTDDTEFPVLLMDWVEGETLDKYIKNHINEPTCLNLLAGRFCIFADWLLKQPFAHGDLKPDNILVKDDGTLVAVDYDGMYVPKMRGQKARELGSPDFRHPQRTEDDFDEHIDDFAIVTLLLSIKAIALNPSLCTKDCILLRDKDFSNLAQSVVIHKLQELIDDSDFAKLYAMFVIVLAHSKLDVEVIKWFSSWVSKVDLNELEYLFVRNLYNSYGNICVPIQNFVSHLHNAYSIFEKLSDQIHFDPVLSLLTCFSEIKGCKHTKNVFLISLFFAEKGDEKAQFIVGNCYLYGVCVDKNIKIAIEWILKSAEQGYVYAQNFIGNCYNDLNSTYGLDFDVKSAVVWYSKASIQGYSPAQHNLAVCYQCGEGVEQDKKKAYQLFLQAAEQGYAKAQVSLGLCYECGDGVEEDYQKAVEWYTKAAFQGDCYAQYHLGFCYENGIGVHLNLQMAVDWYMKSSQQGNSFAQKILDEWEGKYGINADYKEVVRQSITSAEQGNIYAINKLAFCYYYGYGIEHNNLKAIELYTNAANCGSIKAQFELGKIYEHEQNIDKSIEWYLKAAENGDVHAQQKIACCYEKGQGLEQNLEKAIFWYTKVLKHGGEISKLIAENKIHELKNLSLNCDWLN
ncbi:MAG: AarF/UbiB family protein [Bacteroidales bacterium]|nr:AarF/UbiB family protein [Bacteroidales bacterium]